MSLMQQGITAPTALEVACDESGFTGSDLLQKDQRYFTYASVEVSDVEAFEMIKSARRLHPVQMPELKARALMGSSRGRELIASLLSSLEGRYTVSVNDKLLALCGWFFEYIYEPVYQRDPRLLYEKNLHRFVAMYTWLWMNDHQCEARETIEQFQRYMRSRNPGDAPVLFARPRPKLTEEESEHPFEFVLRFAYGYRDIIIADNANIETETPDGGRWILDLSTSAIWSHLNRWGALGRPLSVQCDVNKAAQAFIPNFTGDESDPCIRRAREKGSKDRLGWTLLKPVAFVDSRDHPAVQLADVIAGATRAIFSNDFPAEWKGLGEIIGRHLHPHSLLPDMEVIDPSTKSAAVNAVVLYDLAKRAERHGDPYAGLADVYRRTEIGWVKGEYSLSPARA